MVNWNNVLAYTTPKLVKIRNWRIGLIHTLLMVAIVIYIIVYAIVLQKGFMKLEQITGGVVTSNFKEPAGEFYNQAEALGYCCDGCEPNQPPNTTDYLDMSCVFWDEYQSDFPNSINNQIALTSRVKVSRQVASASTCTVREWGSNCTFVNDPLYNFTNATGDAVQRGVLTEAYVANLENFTILIRHGVHGMNVPTQGGNSGKNPIVGFLVDTHSEVPIFGVPRKIRSWPSDPYYVGNGFSINQAVGRTGDVIRVSEILDSVGLNLDDIQQGGTDRESYRYAGINIVMYIRYEMIVSDLTGSTIQYTYEPRVLSDLEYKIEQNVNEILPQEEGEAAARLIYNRHAIRLVYIQTGEVGGADIQAVLLTFVTGLGLLTVASLVVNILISHVLELKAFYTDKRIEVTEEIDFKVLATNDTPKDDAYIDTKEELSDRTHLLETHTPSGNNNNNSNSIETTA